MTKKSRAAVQRHLQAAAAARSRFAQGTRFVLLKKEGALPAVRIDMMPSVVSQELKCFSIVGLKELIETVERLKQESEKEASCIISPSAP